MLRLAAGQRLRRIQTCGRRSDQIGRARNSAKQNIRINAVAPGPIVTEMWERFSGEAKEQVIATVPVGQIGAAEQIAAGGSISLLMLQNLPPAHHSSSMAATSLGKARCEESKIQLQIPSLASAKLSR